MKKYLAGFLLIALFAVVGGLKLINEKSASASLACSPVGSTQGSGGLCPQVCANTGQANGGVWVYTGPSASICGAMINVDSGVISGLTSTRPVLTWTVSPNATSYNLQISDRSDFSNIVFQKSNIVGNSYNMGTYGGDEQSNGLALNKKYYFRVQAANQFGTSAWSNTFSFTTAGQSAVGSPSVVAPSAGFTTDSLFSLLIANGASWTSAGGSKVFPKQVTPRMNYYDENNNQIYLSGADVTKVSNLISSIWDSRSQVSGGTNGGPSATLPACGSGNYNTTSGGYTCCTSGWVWMYTGSASVCSGASVVVGSGPVSSLALPACGAGNVTQSIGGFKCCKSSNTTYSWYTGWTGTDAQCAAITVGSGASNSVSVQ